MPPEGFEPTIPAGERPETHAFDRAANGFSNMLLVLINPKTTCFDPYLGHLHAIIHIKEITIACFI
jgi:hypothetical protein